MKSLFSWALAGCILAGAVPARAQSYAVTDLGLPAGATAATSLGANDSGTVVGLMTPRSGGSTSPVKFIHGRAVDLARRASLTLTWGQATAINRHGTLVGAVGTADRPKGWLMISRGQDLTLVRPPGRGLLEVQGVDDHGRVVGTANRADGACRCAFVYHPDTGQWDFLPGPDHDPDSVGRAIDAHGRVYGTARLQQAQRAVVWHHGKPVALPDLGGGFAMANAVNRLGDVVGESLTPSAGARRHAMWIHDGVATDLDGDDQRESSARSVNDAGVVVGTLTEADFTQSGFVAQGGQRLVDLNHRLAADSKALWRIERADHVDAQGRIAATAWSRQGLGRRAVLLIPQDGGR